MFVVSVLARKGGTGKSSAALVVQAASDLAGQVAWFGARGVDLILIDTPPTAAPVVNAALAAIGYPYAYAEGLTPQERARAELAKVWAWLQRIGVVATAPYDIVAAAAKPARPPGPATRRGTTEAGIAGAVA